ncbi:hypothetical protein CBR_g31792 [Chara braunii]|uniref:Uncharacterized protein n=1 Tax=Chara braunii TaxID=69332 RepID=A0A388LFN0_CHABU|nr:hypothetical protein CBR_g31792 [Chara braunii]|eukprot:GBG81116.1 hypothetical protein CBR_g31792 [Chara braunii]
METTSLSGTQCPVDSDTTTYHGFECDNQEPFSAAPEDGARINPNLEDLSFRKVQFAEDEHSNLEQEDVSTTTDVAKELHGGPSSFAVRCQNKASKSLDSELAPGSPLSRPAEPTMEALARMSTDGGALESDVHRMHPKQTDAEVGLVGVERCEGIEAETPKATQSAWARMNPIAGVVSKSIDDGALVSDIIRIDPKHTDAGVETVAAEECREVGEDRSSPKGSEWTTVNPDLVDAGMSTDEIVVIRMHPTKTIGGATHVGVEDCRHVTTSVTKDGSSAALSVEARIYPNQSDLMRTVDSSGYQMSAIGMEHRVIPPGEDPLYSSSPAQSLHVVDLDSLSPIKSGRKLSVASGEVLGLRETVVTPSIVDADISDLSSFPASLEHVIAASTRTGSPVVLGLPAVGVVEVEPKPGKR